MTKLPYGEFHVECSFSFFFIYGLGLASSFSRPEKALVPLFFGGLIFLLGYFPELEWLEKWIEGFDLLLLFLGINSFIEERRSSKAHPRKIKRTARIQFMIPAKSFFHLFIS